MDDYHRVYSPRITEFAEYSASEGIQALEFWQPDEQDYLFAGSTIRQGKGRSRVHPQRPADLRGVEAIRVLENTGVVLLGDGRRCFGRPLRLDRKATWNTGSLTGARSKDG